MKKYPIKRITTLIPGVYIADLDTTRGGSYFRCACGSQAAHIYLPTHKDSTTVQLCPDCVQILRLRLRALDETALCDFDHNTWLVYDFHPLRHQSNR